MFNVKSSTSNDNDNKQAMLKERLQLLDQVCRVLLDKGLVAATELSSLDADQLADWMEDLADLTLNIRSIGWGYYHECSNSTAGTRLSSVSQFCQIHGDAITGNAETKIRQCG
jgi:hypothetical protein